MQTTTQDTYELLLFGPLAQMAGSGQVRVRLAGPATAQSLLQALAQQAPTLAPLLAQARLAVNQRCVSADHPVQPDDELAVIALVGGG